MAIILSPIRAGQKPSEAEMARIRAELDEAVKHPIVYGQDCPKLSSDALMQFTSIRARDGAQMPQASLAAVP